MEMLTCCRTNSNKESQLARSESSKPKVGKAQGRALPVTVRDISNSASRRGLPEGGFEKSLQSQRSRMESRNPLEKTYEMTRDHVPYAPKAGDVLVFKRKEPVSPLQTESKASWSTPTSATTTTASNPSFEAFFPEVNGEPNDTKDPLDGDPFSLGSHFKTRIVSYEGPMSEDLSGKEETLMEDVWGMKVPAKEPALVQDDSDHLSDVPSDIDSITKGRYLLACQLLKAALVAKDKVLVPIEREYILSLLGDGEEEGDALSEMSAEHLSAIESAAWKLGNDPLFRDPAKVSAVPHSITTKNDQPHVIPPSEDFSVSKTATTFHFQPSKKSQQRARSFPRCTPASSSEAGVLDDEKVYPVEVSEDEPKDPPPLGPTRLVRYDDWQFYNPFEKSNFTILGLDAAFHSGPRVLTPSIMEALRGFLPISCSESNFWLKFSLLRDGTSLTNLLSRIRGSQHTVVGVETDHGEVFGSFTGTCWRSDAKWFGSGEAFLWRLKKSRLTSPRESRQSSYENQIEVYPFTGYDTLVQYCTPKTLAVGGGDWGDVPCPFDDEPRGVGFMIDGDMLGGETNSCATFANPRLAQQISTTNEFSISNLEVWTLTPCLTEDEASNLEMRKLFVGQNGLAK